MSQRFSKIQCCRKVTFHSQNHYSQREKITLQIPMVDIRKSSFVEQGTYSSQKNEFPRYIFRQGFGHGKVVGRTFGIGAFLNNYDLSIDQMAAIDPLPRLSPLRPFPDPYSDETRRPLVDYYKELGRWPCQFKKTERTEQNNFANRRDWMHNWSEYMYSSGYFGGITKK